MSNFEFCARKYVSTVSKLGYLQLPVSNIKRKALHKECGLKFSKDGGIADSKITAVFFKSPMKLLKTGACATVYSASKRRGGK